MKTQRAVLPLAFLSAAFMLGCQEQASGPVGPEGLAPLFDPGGAGKGGGGKKGGSVLAGITVTGGMATTTQGQVVSFKDGKNIIEFQHTEDGLFNLAFNLMETYNAGNAIINAGGSIEDYCVKGGRGSADGPALDNLFDKLIEDFARRNFFIRIDKQSALDGQPSEGHKFNIGWLELESEDGFNVELRGAATVSMTGDINDGLTFVFTGGSIRVKDWRGKVQEHFHLTCPMDPLDVITMELVAQ